MTRQNVVQTQQQASSASPLSRGGILQRQCDGCGQHTIAGGECADCGKKKIGLQRKLTIGASNDPLELEADRVADQVLAAPAHTDVNAAPLRIQRYTGQSTEGANTAPASVDRVLSSLGSPLEPSLQQDMEQRFGHDFSRVRVHADNQAAESARAVNARAFTLGRDVVFGAGEYQPRSAEGQRLLAHELAHVIQQAASPATVQGKLSIGNPSDSAEQAADAAAQTVTTGGASPYKSPSLRLRDSLRTSSLPHATIQRAVNTWGGEFDTDKYELTKDPGMDGVEIEMRFKPGTNVNAELIGMTQIIRYSEKGTPFAIGSGKEKAALESRMIPSGESGAGFGIDRLASKRFPLYGTEAPATGDSLSGGTPTSTTQHGFRFTDGSGKLQKQDAILKDRPKLFSTRKESSQLFETTALAVKGAQTGTFYGSVQWGWEKDAAGTVKKLPLSLVSQGVPSATFGRASELWNQAKTSEGKETIDLPVVSVKVITGAAAQLFATPDDAQSVMIPGTPLPIGTRFRVLRDAQFVWRNPVIYIEVVDGPLTGQRGYILNTVANRNER